jgi:large subunit ribosomal protein L11
MSKTVRVLGTLRTYIPAGKASPSPPLGPALGQSDKSYDMQITTPPTSYFLLAATGLEKGSREPGRKIVGRVSLKHIYEIAQIKQQDPALQRIPLQSICKTIIGSARSIGIEVVR